MSTLDYHALNAPPELYKEHRVGVLFHLLLRANIRLRCWPSMDKIAEKTTISKPVVIKAIHWLQTYGAIEIVPFNLRVDDEKKLPPRLNVYQLTGVLQWEGETIRYLYFAPLPFNGDTQSKESLLSKVKNLDGKESLPKQESESSKESSKSRSSKTKISFPTSDDVKNAFAIVCYGNKNAWELNASTMVGALNKLTAYEKRSLTLDDLREFRQWWKTKDWRGKQQQLPEPYTVVSVWARFRAGEDSTEALTPEPTKPPAEITRGKKRN